MRRHFGDLGHRCQTDVSTIVRVDVFEHPCETWLGDVAPLSSTARLNGDTVPGKVGQMFRLWSILPI